MTLGVTILLAHPFALHLFLSCNRLNHKRIAETSPLVQEYVTNYHYRYLESYSHIKGINHLTVLSLAEAVSLRLNKTPVFSIEIVDELVSNISSQL